VLPGPYPLPDPFLHSVPHLVQDPVANSFLHPVMNAFLDVVTDLVLDTVTDTVPDPLADRISFRTWIRKQIC
jgi:hypothetical protein